MDRKPINCVTTLQSDEYASVIAHSLDEDTIEAITEDKRRLIGVFSPPNSGKSTLLNHKVKRTSDIGLHVVVVTPTIHLNNMLNSVLDGARNFDGNKYTDISKRVIVTTPDGLENVIKILEENHLYFEIHSDEIHERIDSAENRISFDNIDRAIVSKYCVTAFMYTGTPDSIRNYYNFDKVYNIIKTGKRIKNNPKVINLDKMSNEHIKDCIEYAYMNYREEKGQVFIFLNDKTKHSYINEKIDFDIFKCNSVDESEILYISSKTKDDEYIKEMIKNKYIPSKYKIILITSSASAGIEFYLDNPATVMVFCDNYTFNIRQEVQSTIRVRSDINELIFVKPKQKNEKDSYIEYDKFFELKIKQYREYLEEKIEFWEEFKKLKFIKNRGAKTKEQVGQIMNVGFDDYEEEAGCSVALVYNTENEKFEIKDSLLHKYISDEYASLMLRNTNNFIKTMRAQCTQFDFQNQVFEIIDYDNLFKNDELLRVIEDVLETKDTSEQEEKKREIETIIRESKNKLREYDMSIENKINVIGRIDDNLPSNVLHSRLYNAIELLEKHDSTFKALRELLLLSPDKKYYEEYLDGATTYKLNKYKTSEKVKAQIYVAYNLIDKKDFNAIKKQPKAVREKCYTLLFYEKEDNTYKDVRLTKKSREELLLHLQTFGLYKTEKFTDEIDEKLFKLTNELFKNSEIKSENKNKKSKLDKAYKINSLRYKKLKTKN